MVAVWGIKICVLKAPVQWRWSCTILQFASKDLYPFFIFWPFFTYFHSAPPNLGVSSLFFAIKNDYHIIGDECGSSMVCMQPWFTYSLGLHALCSLLYWVQFVNTQGRVQDFIKTACRARVRETLFFGKKSTFFCKKKVIFFCKKKYFFLTKKSNFS